MQRPLSELRHLEDERRRRERAHRRLRRQALGRRIAWIAPALLAALLLACFLAHRLGGLPWPL